MEAFELEHTEIDGLLYPNIEIGRKSALDNRTLWQNRWH